MTFTNRRSGWGYSRKGRKIRDTAGRRAHGRYRSLALEILENRINLSGNPFPSIANSLDMSLTALQGQISGVLDQGNGIPFIGNALGTTDAGKVINTFQQSVHDALFNLPGSSFPSDDAIRSALYAKLGSELGNIGQPSNIYIAHPGALDDAHGDPGIVVDMLVNGQTPGSAIPFATGLPSLPIQVTANVTASAQFTYELGFQYNANTQITSFVDPAYRQPLAANPLTVTVLAQPTFTGGANIGFVHGSVATAGANNVNITFTMDSLDAPSAATLSGSANMNLHLQGGLGPNADFPSIGADFHLSWDFNAPDPSPAVSFDNVTLALGGFMTGVLKPILTEIQCVTKPILPVLKVLNKDLPGISDISEFLGGPSITLLTLAGEAAGAADYGPLFSLVSTVENLILQFDTFDTQDTQDASIHLGGFSVAQTGSVQDLSKAPAAGNLMDLADGNLTPDLLVSGVTQSSAGPPLSQLPRGATNLVNTLQSGSTDPTAFNFAFPILDDPADAVFAMLLGKDAPLVTLTADIHLDANQSPPGLSFAGEGVTFNAHAQIDGHIVIGYDTYGIREAIEDLTNGTGNIGDDIRDGIYVAAGPAAQGGSYFTINGGIDAGPELSFGIFDLALQGGIDTSAGGPNSGPGPVSFALADPSGDGKLRFGHGPGRFTTSSIVTSGVLTAGLNLTIKIGVTVPVLGFVGFSQGFGLGSVVILDLNPPPPGPPPTPQVAGSFDGGGNPVPMVDANGQLTLFVGALSDDRRLFDVYNSYSPLTEDEQDDGKMVEDYTITHVSGDASTGETLDVSAFGITQTITGVKSIVAQGDMNDLKINVGAGVTAAVNFHGGQNAANFTYSGTGGPAIGSVLLYAGAKDSTLTDTSGRAGLHGGPGNDVLTGTGNDGFDGGAGNNTMIVEGAYYGLGILGGPDPSANNTVEFLVPQANENISISRSEIGGGQILIDDAKQHILVQTIFSNITHVVVGGGGGSAITIGDLSGTPIASVSVGVSPPPPDPSGSGFVGGIALSQLRGNLVTIDGSSGTNGWLVGSTVDAATGKTLTQALLNMSAGGNAKSLQIGIDGMSSIDALVLDGGRGVNHFDLVMDPHLHYGRTVRNFNPASDLTVAGQSLPAGNLTVTDSTVQFQYLQREGATIASRDDQVSFDPIGTFDVNTGASEAIYGQRSTGATSIYGAGNNAFDVIGTSNYSLYGLAGINSYDVHLPLFGGKTTIFGIANDSLTVDDTANLANLSTNYTVAAGSVTRVDEDAFPIGGSTLTLAATSAVTFTPMGQVALDTNTSLGITAETHIEATAAGTATTINENAAANDAYISQAQHDLALIAGPLTIAGSGYNRVLMYDNPSKFRISAQITVTPVSVARVASSRIGLDVSSNSETIHYSDVSEIDLFTPKTALIVDSLDISQGNVIGIKGALERSFVAYNSGGYQVTGSLLPAVLFGDNLTSLNLVESGIAANFEVYDTPAAFPTTLQMGYSGGVVVHGTTGPLTINGGPDVSQVFLGDPSPQGGSLAALDGAVTVNGGSGALALDVDYSGDAGVFHGVLSASRLTGVAPAAILLGAGIQTLTIHTGASPGSDFTVKDSPASATTYIDGGAGGDIVNVSGTTGPVVVNTGAGTNVVNVGSPGNLLYKVLSLTVNGGIGGITTLNLNDQANANGDLVIDASGGPAVVITSPTYAITSQSITRSDIRETIDQLTGQVAIGTTVGTVSYNNVASIAIRGGQSDNVFDVQSTGAATPVTINAGSGGDTINVGNGAGPINVDNPGDLLDPIQGPVTIDGQAGVNTLNINDQGASPGQSYVVTANGLARAGAAMITFTGIQNVVLNSSPGSNAGPSYVDIQGTAARTALTVNAGVLSDISVQNAANRLDDILGPVTINGQPYESFSINDLGNTVGHTYTLTTVPGALPTANRLTRDGAAPITFSGLNTLQMTGGTGANIFNIESLANNYITRIYGGGGADLFNVSPKAHDLDNLAGILDLEGEFPGQPTANASLTINDQSHTGARNWLFGAYGLVAYPSTGSAAQAVQIDFDVFNTVVANCGSGGNTINVVGMAAGTPVTINAGSGGDTIKVGSAGNLLDPVQGPLTINGQGGNNALNVNDQGAADFHYYDVSATAVRRLNANAQADMAPITYAGIQTLIVSAGSAGDYFDATSTRAGTSTILNGGAGVDEFVVSGNSTLDDMKGPLTLHPNGGSYNSVELSDFLNPNGQTYNFTGTSLQRSGIALISWDPVAVGLFASDVATSVSRINVQSVSAGYAQSFAMGTNDVLTVGSKAPGLGGNLDNILGSVVAEAYAGQMPSVVIDDSGDTTAHPNVVVAADVTNGDVVTGLAPAPLYLRQNTAATLDGGIGGNTFDVQSTASGTSTTINAGNGENTVNVGNGSGPVNTDNPGRLDPIQGPLTINGKGGNTSLNVNDQGAADFQYYEVSADGVSRLNDQSQQDMAPITYAGIQTLTLNAGSADDIVGASSTLAGTSTILNGGAGNDEFVVTGNSTLDGLKGPLMLHTNGGINDYVEFSDALNPVQQTYNFTATSLNRSRIALVTWDPMSQVILYTGAGADHVNVQSVSASTFESLVVGTGDTVTIGSNAPAQGGNLSNILGPVRVEGFSGQTPTVIIDDSGDTTARPDVVLDSAGIYGNIITGLAPAPIYLQLNPAAPTTIMGASGNDVFTINAPQATSGLTLNGGGGTNTLVGSASTTNWQLTGANRGSTSGINFINMQNLVGGPASDTFTFGPQGSESGSIDGGGGGDWLDYGQVTSNVTVNLATGSASRVAGGIANIQNVVGGTGRNVLTGNAQGNILVGGPSTNVLTGGSGRSILIGGGGPSTITGGSGDDILIGGTVNFAARDAALLAIMAEWQRTDETYAVRISNLRTGRGLNGSNTLILGQTVLGNGAADVLTGGDGLDWFWDLPGDTITDLNRDGSETIN